MRKLSNWHRIYSVNLILYKSSDLKPLSPLEVLGEFAKNRFGKNFPVAVTNRNGCFLRQLMTDRLKRMLRILSRHGPRVGARRNIRRNVTRDT